MAVQSLQKPANTPCQHLCHNGCDRYDTRPRECVVYNCYWLYNSLPVELRPDQLGLLVELAESKLGPVVVVTEVTPDAFAERRAQDFVAQVALAHKAFICLDHGSGPKELLFPPWAAHLESRAAELVRPAMAIEEAVAERPGKTREEVAQERRDLLLAKKKAKDERRKKGLNDKKTKTWSQGFIKGR
jgi:hypothetical protein